MLKFLEQDFVNEVIEWAVQNDEDLPINIISEEAPEPNERSVRFINYWRYWLVQELTGDFRDARKYACEVYFTTSVHALVMIVDGSTKHGVAVDLTTGEQLESELTTPNHSESKAAAEEAIARIMKT